MANISVFVLLLFSLLFSQNTFSAAVDWYSYYIQCIATSSQESSCYDAIRDYLSTEEGKRQAEEIGFKRKLFRDSNQAVSQVVVISNRVQQMETYLSRAFEKAQDEKDSVRVFCLSEKSMQMKAIKKNIEEKKTYLLSNATQTSSEIVEQDYELLLSLNSRANELYGQARKCLE